MSLWTQYRTEWLEKVAPHLGDMDLCFLPIRQCLLGLLLVTTSLTDNCALGGQPRDSGLTNSRVRHWLGQWDKHLGRASLNDGKPLKLTGGNAIAFAEYLAEMDQCASAIALCERIKPIEEAYQAITNLPAVFICSGNVSEAYDLASSLKERPPVQVNGEEYNRYRGAMYLMMSAYARKEDYAEAKEIIRRTSDFDPKWAAILWCRLAESMARHGYCDKALSCIDMVSHMEAVKEFRQHSLEVIGRCKQGDVGSRRHVNDTEDGLSRLLQKLRATAGILTRSTIPKSVDSVEERKKYISSIQDPSRRAALWREVGWNHWHADHLQLAREAADKCHEAVLEIPPALEAVRTTESALLADLYFAVGRKQQAIDLVKNMVANEDRPSKTGSVQHVAGSLGSLVGDEDAGIVHEFAQVLGSGALMTSVLVRAGGVSTAFEVAKKNWDSEFSVHQWRYLGAICAFCDQVEYVEAQLDHIDSELAKAFLCLGVAYGLHEKELASP